MRSITSITPTICKLMDTGPPSISCSEPIAEAVEACARSGVSKVDRCLFYTPDAIGTGFYLRNSGLLTPVARIAPIEVRLKSVVPPKTPVCYASMFTGAEPEVHGVRTYIKKMLECETLFDSLAKAAVRQAIVAVEDSSMDLMFRGRAVEGFSETYDSQVTERALELVRSGSHDFIVVYHQEYDDVMHKTHPESLPAKEAAGRHVASFARLVEACRTSWAGRAWLAVFAPDHGAHVDTVTGQGTHGDDIPDDMEVTHFFGIHT